MTTSEVQIRHVANTLAASGALRNLQRLKEIRWTDGLQVLLVEDDEADAYLIRRALATNPRVSDVVLATDGDDALELFDRRRVFPDLALVDLRMPRKDGLAFLKEIAARSAAQFPCFVLTSSKSAKDAGRAMRRDAVGFVTKPKSPTDLQLALDRILADVA